MVSTSGSDASATRYDVFLSFRGPDTRKTFTDGLYRTMVGQGIDAYIDSEELHAGDRIDDLLRAVGHSKICIPIFSKRYASSDWCLRELARMVELNELNGKPEILPIFFDVKPSDVKLRTELYVKDLKEHEGRHGSESKEQWEAALRKVPELKGWEIQEKTYGEVIELVVREVMAKLKVKQRLLDDKLVGVDEQVEAIMKLLDADSSTGVRFVGIYGMGGIGKTTLANIVFNRLCPCFDGQCSIIENVRECSKGNRLVNLQEQLASDISDSRFKGNFSNTNEGIHGITRRACSKKVLIVLDDLDKEEQLKQLVGGRNTFGYGSRIIITTRDKRILNEEWGILPYEATQMDRDKAQELFNLHAFNNASPPDAFWSLSREVASTCGGLPLALKVIGSSLRGKEIERWKASLKKLQKVPHGNVQEQLKISYDALENEEKEIFLDIACFFVDFESRETYFWDSCKSRATYFWDACGLFPDIALEKLTDLCLIKIVDGSAIRMHDQLIDLGRYIVCQESDMNLTGRSRLWNDKEALEVVRSKERKDKLRALNLSGSWWHPINIVDEELERMPNLKFLKLRGGTFVGDINNHLQKLIWLSWDSPLRCATTNFHLENLAVLKLSGVLPGKNWGGWNILKMANNLKDLSLSECTGLRRTPDFSGCLSLERLSLSGCRGLQEVDSSIGKLNRLTHLTIVSCDNLRNLPEETGGLVNMTHFSINSCGDMEKLPFSIGDLKKLEFLLIPRSLQKLPESIGNLKSLQKLVLRGSSIVDLPDSIENLKQLKVLDIRRSEIRGLPASIGKLERLDELHASDCKLDGELPTEIGELSCLRILDLSRTRVCAVPTAINSLTRLQNLDLTDCNELQALPKLPPSLSCLRVQSTSLRLVPDLSNLTNLVELNLSNRSGRALAQASNPMQTLQLQGVGKLSKLEKLRLCLSDVPVPSSELGCLPLLRELTFSSTDSCNSVVVGPQFSNLKYLSILCLYRSPLKKIRLDGLELLRELKVWCCEFLEGLSTILSSLRKLRRMVVVACPKLLEIQFSCTMESLEYLCVSGCKSLGGLCGLSNSKRLKRIWIEECNGLRVIEDLEELELLHNLYIYRCGSLDISNSKISNECWIDALGCEKLLDTEEGGTRYGEYKDMILGWTRKRKTFNLVLEDSIEENDTTDCSNSENSMKDNDSKPLLVFQRKRVRRKTGQVHCLAG